MMDIDWSKAPEATHYDARPGCDPAFMRKNHNGRDWEFLGMGGNWVMYGTLCNSQLKGLIERPKPWTGEGLPPVGCKVLIGSAGGNEWIEHFEGREAEVISHNVSGSGEPTAVFKTLDDEGFPIYHALVADNGNFLPIRSAEQIAVEEREKGIEQMVKELIDTEKDGFEYLRCALLYDAGYRKQVTP